MEKRYARLMRIGLIVLLSLAVVPSRATVYTVNSLSDANTGAGASGTLRWCINQANLSAGPHTINFSVAGTISVVGSSMPALTRAITVDGSTAPGFVDCPVVTVDGASTPRAGNNSDRGLEIAYANCALYALTITNFTTVWGRGIWVNGDGSDNFTIGASGKGNVIITNGGSGIFVDGADNGFIRGNRIGIDGTAAAGNGGTTAAGVNIWQFSNFNTVADNVITNSGYDGVLLDDASNNTIQNNQIGVAPNGTCSDRGNATFGVRLVDNSDNNIIRNNVIAYNDYGGVDIGNPGATMTDFNLISQNAIYCNKGGGFGDYGISLNSWGNDGYAAPVVTSANGSGASGTSPANAVIEIFIADLCSGALYQGKEYKGTATANGAGSWSYVGVLYGRVVATARDPVNNNTSQFSASFSTGPGSAASPSCGPTCSITLPVTLLSFTANVRDGPEVELRWQAVPAPGDLYFVVERAVPSDGALMPGEFSTVGAVYADPGQGNPAEYVLTDDNPRQGINYYRLKQAYYDGSHSLSEIVKVNVKVRGVFAITGMRTAAGVSEIRFSMPSAYDVGYEILDLTGNRVLSGSLGRIEAGYHAVKIGTGTLPAGIYGLILTSGQESVSGRMLLY